MILPFHQLAFQVLSRQKRHPRPQDVKPGKPLLHCSLQVHQRCPRRLPLLQVKYPLPLPFPASLQLPAAPRRACCGLALGAPSAAVAYDGDLGSGEVCERGLPRPARRIAARLAAPASAVALFSLDPMV